jgi:hypothetical protein
VAVRPRDHRGDRYGFPGADPRADGGDAPSSYGRDARTRCDPDLVRTADVIAEGVRAARPADVPVRLCRAAVTLLPVAGASVSLCGAGMPFWISASSEQAAHLADIQATLGEGPCRYAAQVAAPVLASDLTAGRDVRRWPVFAQQATAAGAQAVYSMPLGGGGVTVGTLDLYRATPGRLTEQELRRALLLAGVMTLALMVLSRQEDECGGAEPWLGGLAEDYDKVHQAIGVSMAQLGVDADEAGARLRGHAFAQGRTALEVARDVVARREKLDDG